MNVKLATKGKSQYQIFDLAGRLVKSGNISDDQNLISISELKTGNYRLVLTANGTAYSQSLIVK